MKNSFFLTACRFHTKEKNKLLIIGYFGTNQKEGNQPVIALDDLKLTYSVEEHRLKPLHFKMVDGQMITKHYFLWVQLPETWKTYRQLRISNLYDGQIEYITAIHIKKIRKLEQRIAKNIDSINVGKEGFQIEGWFVSPGKAGVSFLDMNGKELPVEVSWVKRPDVLWEYPENEAMEVYGFSAVYKGEVPGKVKVRFEADEKRAEDIVKIKELFVEKVVKEAKEMFRKTKDYYRQFGLEATLIRTCDKLRGREYTGYEEWLRRHQPSKRVLQKQKKQKFKYMPKISIVVPLYRTPEGYLREMIESVRNQSYTNWELCLSDGSGEDSPIIGILKAYEKKDNRIRVIYNNRQLHISDNTNEALKIATGDYIAFADHDDLLTPNALYECVCAINESPDIELIYSDEDKINMDGTEYFLPHFKSDFNLDMLRSTNYFCHLVVVKRELVLQVGMLNAEFDGAQDYDYVLRCIEKTTKIKHIPKILYHWRACAGSTAENAENKEYIIKAGAKAVKAHYERLEIDAEVIPTQFAGMYRTRYKLKGTPMVSVIIPNKDHVEDLDKCMRSLEEKNEYENIEYIIVENNSQEKQTFEYYKDLEKRNSKAKVIYWKEKGFNYPAINTFGVKHACGEYLLFLNNDTEILHGDCVEELLSHCMREEVGAVGARLYYEDGTLQHGGVIVGLGGVAGHAHLGLPEGAPGYFARAKIVQNLSAVTAACMMMKRSVYNEVGGFDESYAVAFNDVDLCLKIREAGYLIVYNPYAELMHYESKSRGYDDTEEKIKRFQKEISLFQTKWREFLADGDPYYNPNLTLDRNDFSINTTVNKERR